MDKRVKTHIEAIQASAIVVKNGDQPVRIVLYQRNGEYVTHMECLTTLTPTDGTSSAFEHHSLLHGGYFPYKSASRMMVEASDTEALYHAQADFKERVRKLFATG